MIWFGILSPYVVQAHVVVEPGDEVFILPGALVLMVVKIMAVVVMAEFGNTFRRGSR